MTETERKRQAKLDTILEELNQHIAKIEFLLSPTRPCPHCGHPVISAPFCEDTPVQCPDCGEHSVWTFKDGKYRLEMAGQ